MRTKIDDLLDQNINDPPVTIKSNPPLPPRQQAEKDIALLQFCELAFTASNEEL